MPAVQTGQYVFLSDQSTLVQTGGIAGVHRTYFVEGQFQLTVDPNAGTASFGYVDANAIDDSPFRRTLDPNEVFNMTSLLGTVLADMKIAFRGKADNGSDVLITVTLEDNLVQVVAETTPPAGSADFFVFNMNAVAQRKYGGGCGTPENPYRIATAKDLIAFSNNTNHYAKHFVLTADIDLSTYTFTTAVIAPDANNTIDGFQGTDFIGSFNGNNFKITDLTIDAGLTSNDWLGLFGKIGIGGKVRNLYLENVTVTGSNDSEGIGCLAGYNASGSISRCQVIGGISTGDHSCTLGGLVGSNIGGSITNSYAISNIRQGSNSIGLGGLAGRSSDGSIHRCYARSNVSTGNDPINTGGLVGNSSRDRISDCYAICNIVAGDNASQLGGLTGSSSEGSITNCYAAGTVNIGAQYSFVGGLVGAGGGVTNSYWDIDANGLTLRGGGSRKSTAELEDPNTFLGWNCCGEIVWTINPGKDYPRLAWENSPGIPIPSYNLSDFLVGSGIAEDPYRISSPEDLDKVGRFLCDWNKHFVLMEDVDLSAYAGDRYHIIGGPLEQGFSGVFDGNGHVIRNLSIQNGTLEYVGIFGRIVGKVANLGIENVKITCANASAWLGGLGGENWGIVTNCYAISNISGGNQSRLIGGLIGANWGTIANCYATGNVSGGRSSMFLGGLAGNNNSSLDSIIMNSYATTSVSGGNDSLWIGGLVGSNLGVVINCYAAGSVTSDGNSSYIGGLTGYGGCGCDGSISICKNSFWDMENSGWTTSACGAGKTTAEMKRRSTFTSASWDFVGETENGIEDIWWILEGKDYPRLWWERSEEP